MPPSSNRSKPTAIAVSASLALGCASAPRQVVQDDAPRRPDGVAIDLPSAPPSATAEAAAGDGVVALVTPLGTDVARAVVERFFNAIVAEDRATLGDLLAGTARSFNPTTGEEVDANYFWNRRFDTFDYTPLATQSVFRRDAVEVFRIDQWNRATQSAGLGTVYAASDVVARVRLPTVTSSKPILGDSIALQLRRVGSTYQIVRLTEDFSFQ